MISLESIRLRDEALAARFGSRMEVNNHLSRTLVSFQANKMEQGFRWFKYKEGFSAALVNYLLDHLVIERGKILDPFAGAGTTLFVASNRRLDSVGIELLPIGQEIIEVRKLAASPRKNELLTNLRRWRQTMPWKSSKQSEPFPHLKITLGAFPRETERGIGKFMAARKRETSISTQRLLRFALLCVLEQISYTRKDGQYLRWDYRSGRRQGTKKFDKGEIHDFDAVMARKLEEIADDLSEDIGVLNLFPTEGQPGQIEVIRGSALETLPLIPPNHFDAIITSPPYCNRYDYTRTYALELGLLGVKEDELRQLRQAMLSCTVENRDKPDLFRLFDPHQYSTATQTYDAQDCLKDIVQYLEDKKTGGELNNNGIPRMVRNYFWEMTLVICECARILKPGLSLRTSPIAHLTT